jgi:enamine deaminase RidA (YjgF/YER057c/UK114 family)
LKRAAARPNLTAKPIGKKSACARDVEPISHFTHVVRAGNIVFVSGCVASDGQGRTVGRDDDPPPRRGQALENIKRCLTPAGATFADVCKVTVFLKNMADREKVNVARKEYFGPHRPASTLVEISKFVRDGHPGRDRGHRGAWRDERGDAADVVVIGGGVNGASIAYALAARGVKRVVLLEQGPLAHGASGRSSALVRMHYTNEWDARLAWASFPVFRHWSELMGGRRYSPNRLRERGRA